MKLAVIPALAAILLSPCALSNDSALAQTPSAQQSVKKKKAETVQPAPRYASPYSADVHRPEYDVYVKGAYVGSDPDPRIRYTLEREAKGGYGVRQ